MSDWFDAWTIAYGMTGGQLLCPLCPAKAPQRWIELPYPQATVAEIRRVAAKHRRLHVR